STSAFTTSSLTKFPAFSLASTAVPTELPKRTCARSISPVEICGIPSDLASSFDCVPFPDPGEPNRMTASGWRLGVRVWVVRQAPVSVLATYAPSPISQTLKRGSPSADPSGAGREAFIVAHDQLRLDLV